MSTRAGVFTRTRLARTYDRERSLLPLRGLSHAAMLFITGAIVAVAPDAAVAQNCTGRCLFDQLIVPITAPASDQNTSEREGSLRFWELSERRSAGSRPHWTISAEAIGLGRVGGIDQPLVARVPGTVQFYQTASAPSVEALNSNQFRSFSAGPRVSIVYRGDSGYGVEVSYFNVFNQTATKAVGPDSPADWLVMKAPGTFWQTQDFAYQAMVWSSTTSLYGAEANARKEVSGRVTVLAGVRWFQLNDSLLGTLTPPDLTEPSWKKTCYFTGNCDIFHITPGGTAGNYPPFWTTTTTNNLYGVQIGVDATLLEFGRVSLGGLLKAGLFDNYAVQSTGVSMQKVVYPSQATTNQAAFASEVGLQVRYQVTEGLAVKAGYRVLWFAGVALAPGQIPETSTTPSSVVARGVNCGSNALFQGATAGLEYSF